MPDAPSPQIDALPHPATVDGVGVAGPRHDDPPLIPQMDVHMTLLLSDPSKTSADSALVTDVDVRKAPTPETVEQARRVVAELERVRDQLLETRRQLDRFIEAAEAGLVR